MNFMIEHQLSDLFDCFVFVKRHIHGDLNKGHLAYNITDSSGAFGLNLLIQNMILMPDITDLPIEIILQKIGRVGRQGQLASGFVYITEPSILKKLFNH